MQIDFVYIFLSVMSFSLLVSGGSFVRAEEISYCDKENVTDLAGVELERWLSDSAVDGSVRVLHSVQEYGLIGIEIFDTSCHSMFVALTGAELSLGTGTTTAPSPLVPSNEFFLSPPFVKALAAELTR